jgi:ribosomal protein L40E
MKVCGNCGNQLNDNAVKCPECKRSVCLNCGNPIGAGVTKCPKCGEQTLAGGLQSIGCIMFIVGAVILIVFAVIMFI